MFPFTICEGGHAMVSHHVFYQLVLVVLVWLCLMLHYAWPSNRPAPAQPSPQPLAPRRKRSKEPKPFTSLTRKPHCDACEQAIGVPRLPPPPAPPPKITSTRGRRRHVDTSHHFCPDLDCRYGGWAELGNLRANGHPSGGPWPQRYCSRCQGYFLETYGTIFHSQQMSV